MHGLKNQGAFRVGLAEEYPPSVVLRTISCWWSSPLGNVTWLTFLCPKETRGLPVSLALLAPLVRKVSVAALALRGRGERRECAVLPAFVGRLAPQARRGNPVHVELRDPVAVMGGMESVQPTVLSGQEVLRAHQGHRVRLAPRGLQGPPGGLIESLVFGSRRILRLCGKAAPQVWGRWAERGSGLRAHDRGSCWRLPCSRRWWHAARPPTGWGGSIHADSHTPHAHTPRTRTR